MACACNKSRTASAGSTTVSGTYRVMVNGRKVYETTNESAAATVAERFSEATILSPGESG